MSFVDVFQIFLFLATILILAPLLGNYMARVYTNQRHPLFFLKPFERFLYKMLSIDETSTMTWKSYALCIASFSIVSIVIVYLILVTQQWLPLNPQNYKNLKWDIALNTAVSFVTNTNWQNYSGESSLSYFSQMVGLTVQNFASAAVGMSVVIVLIRGLINQGKNPGEASGAHNSFWVDMTRSILYILLPLSLIVSGILVSQGVIQNFNPYQTVVTFEEKPQILPMGPAASQIAIKQLGTNGGGFFGVNSSHPFENPTPFSNFIELISLIILTASFPFMFGRLVKNKKQGYVIFAVMFILLTAGIIISLYSEYSYGTMEGKEMRFGITGSILWSTATTATSSGSVNAMHDSLSPLAGMITLINIMVGEVIFGGIGCGLYGMLAFIFISVFICGLMVGRSPEYLGKKIESFEIKLAIIIVILPTALLLIFTAAGVMLPGVLEARTNTGPHGLSEILYGFASPAANNGSAFAGLNSNTLFFNLSQGFIMLVSRFVIIFLTLAIAGSFAVKKRIPPGEGTFPTDTILFGAVLSGVILIIGGLSFFPVLTLGPVLEHLGMLKGIFM